MDSLLEYLVVAAIALAILIVGVHLLPAAIAALLSIVLAVLPGVVMIWFVFAVLRALIGHIRG